MSLICSGGQGTDFDPAVNLGTELEDLIFENSPLNVGVGGKNCHHRLSKQGKQP